MRKDKGERRKFEDGVLRVDACFERHYLPREEQYATRWESDDSWYGQKALWEERRLLGRAWALKSQGKRPLPGQSLEDFVASHEEGGDL